MAYKFNPFSGTLDIDTTGANEAPADAQYVTLATNGTLTSERVLTGTANQIALTDNGAGSTVVLSAPQNIHTGASPTFSGLTLSGFTSGSVTFAGTSGVLSQDNANLFWDDANNRLLVGTNSALGAKLGILIGSTTEKGIMIKAAGSQSANLFELWDASNNLVMSINNTAATISMPVAFAMGNLALASGSQAIALGFSASASDTNAVALGPAAGASASGAVAIGVSAQASVTNTIAIGNSATANQANSAVIGAGLNLAADELSWGNIGGLGSVAHLRLTGYSSASPRSLFYIQTAWADATDATRKARAILSVNDAGEPITGREGIRIESNGSVSMVGIGGTSPTARFHLPAGTASANTAPLKLTSGTLLTSAEAGAVEFLTDIAYLTITTGTARKEMTLNDAALTSGRVPFVTTNGRLTDDADMTFATDTLTVTNVVVGGGASVGRLDHGTYSPALTNVANLDASTAYECQYLRVGNTVTVSGKVDVDPTLTATSTQLGIALPIASNLGAAEDCAGTAFASGIAGQGAAILGDATNNRAQMQWISTDVTNQPMYFTFTYQVI